MNKKRILYICRSLNDGGESIFIINLISLLSSSYEIKVCSLFSNQSLSLNNSEISHRLILKKPVVSMNGLRNLYKEANKSDIVQQFVFGLYSLIFFILVQFTNKKQIVTFHTNLVGKFGVIKRVYSFMLRILIVNYMIIFAERFVFITESQMESFKSVCLFKKMFIRKSTYIYNFIDSKNIVTKKRILGNIVRIAFVGRLTKEKGFDVFLQAARHFSNNNSYHFFAIGSSNNQSDFDIPSNVTIIGSVSNKEINTYYDSCDILLMCSRDETFSLVIIEAMARGLVVLSSKLAAIQEYFVHNRNGYLYTVDDSSEVVKYLVYLKNNPAVFEQLSSNNISDAFRFDEKSASEAYKALYV